MTISRVPDDTEAGTVRYRKLYPMDAGVSWNCTVLTMVNVCGPALPGQSTTRPAGCFQLYWSGNVQATQLMQLLQHNELRALFHGLLRLDQHFLHSAVRR